MLQEPENPPSEPEESPESPDRRRFLQDAIPAVLGAAVGGIALDGSESGSEVPTPSPPPGADEEPPSEAKEDLDERANGFLRDNPGFDPFGSVPRTPDAGQRTPDGG